MAARPDRDEFERRLLALVRDYLDGADEAYPDGYEIGDFMVVYEIHERLAASDPLHPWSGGMRAGWAAPAVGFSSTLNQYWLEEAWLLEALRRVRLARDDDQRDRKESVDDE